jgi:hypothetical protein
VDEQIKQEASRPITRRDLFAAAAMAGLIASGEKNAAENVLGARAYADAMLAALDGNHEAGSAES